MNDASSQRFEYRSVLAVCAHPDDESFGLGAVLSTFAELGIETRVLCFTQGEGSKLGPTGEDLAAVRAAELAAAAAVLGVRSFRLLSYPDGGLREAAIEELCREVTTCVDQDSTDCLLVFDEGGITGHPDHQRATEVRAGVRGALRSPGPRMDHPHRCRNDAE